MNRKGPISPLLSILISSICQLCYRKRSNKQCTRSSKPWVLSCGASEVLFADCSLQWSHVCISIVLSDGVVFECVWWIVACVSHPSKAITLAGVSSEAGICRDRAPSRTRDARTSVSQPCFGCSDCLELKLGETICYMFGIRVYYDLLRGFTRQCRREVDGASYTMLYTHRVELCSCGLPVGV